MYIYICIYLEMFSFSSVFFFFSEFASCFSPSCVDHQQVKRRNEPQSLEERREGLYERFLPTWVLAPFEHSQVSLLESVVDAPYLDEVALVEVSESLKGYRKNSCDHQRR